MSLPRIISLFSGAGGLDLGFCDAGFTIVLAIDKSDDAIRTHKRNFKDVDACAADLTDLRADGVLRLLANLVEKGEPIGIIGGPPCQGFSRANSQSQRDDPRNALPLLYLDIVERIQEYYDVQFVLFENVLGILDAKHVDTYSSLITKFHSLNLYEAVGKYCALDYGVPQKRNRVIIAAFKSECVAQRFKPLRTDSVGLTVRNALKGIPEPVFYRKGIHPEEIPFHRNHWTMQPKSPKFSGESQGQFTGRCFRKLDWDKPSPTVAYGHREIHVHPNGHRRLSIYEAMLLQGFPPSFEFEGSLSAQVEQVSNAVPPPLARALADSVAISLEGQEVIRLGV